MLALHMTSCDSLPLYDCCMHYTAIFLSRAVHGEAMLLTHDELKDIHAASHVTITSQECLDTGAHDECSLSATGLALVTSRVTCREQFMIKPTLSQCASRTATELKTSSHLLKEAERFFLG